MYYVAGLVVVYTPPPDTAEDREEMGDGHCQHFFLGHDDDIKSLAVCSAPVQVSNITQTFILSSQLNHTFLGYFDPTNIHV